MKYLRRRWYVFGAMISTLIWLLWPRQLFAGDCKGPIIDPWACADALEYSVWKNLAVGGWNINRVLLIGTYQVNRFRWWLIDVLFQDMYDAMYAIVGPLMEPLAILALTIAALALVAFPIFMKQRMLVGVRQIILLVALGSVVVPQAGQWVADIEHMRSDMVGAIFGDVQENIPSWLFGARADAANANMAEVTMLYPSACYGSPLLRGGTERTTLADGAAALLWADAVDIHCPTQAGVSVAELPAAWTRKDGADYAYNGNLGDESEASERQLYKENIQEGMWRTILAIIPSFTALIEELLQLIFGLCFIALALALPIMWLYAYFQDSYAGLLRLVTGGAQVIKVSLVNSFLLSLISTAVITSASLNDGMSFIAFSCFGVLMLSYLLVVAYRTLVLCIETASTSVERATGHSPTQPVKMAADGIGTVASASVHTAGALATGGASLALTGAAAGVAGAAALRMGGSAGYATGAALGSTRGFAHVGGLMAAMGAMPRSMEQGMATSMAYQQKPHLQMHRIQTMRADVARQQEVISDPQRPSGTHSQPMPQSLPQTQRLMREPQRHIIQPDEHGQAQVMQAPDAHIAQAVTQRLSRRLTPVEDTAFVSTPGGKGSAEPTRTDAHSTAVDRATDLVRARTIPEQQQYERAKQETYTTHDMWNRAQRDYAQAQCEDFPPSVLERYHERVIEREQAYHAAQAREREVFGHYEHKVVQEIEAAQLSQQGEVQVYEQIIEQQRQPTTPQAVQVPVNQAAKGAGPDDGSVGLQQAATKLHQAATKIQQATNTTVGKDTTAKKEQDR